MERTRSFLDERREMLAGSPADFNGIAGLEIDPDDQTRLFVRMVKPLPGVPGGVPSAAPELGAGDVTITGGDRVAGIRVLVVASAGQVLTVDVDQPGDFSTYTLSIDENVPGFDPILREIKFSFKVHCDIDLDCEDPNLPGGDPAEEPRLDYLARDYESYRQMMLDRMAVIVPDWTERNPADLGVTLVEWLAYIGDQLSYKLDHVGTEYSLGTSRLRVSAARHARLTGYRMHNGASARVLAQVELAEGVSTANIPRGDLAFLTRSRTLPDPRIALDAVAHEVDVGAQVFEPLHDAEFHAANHVIALHHWNDPDAILAKGARAAYLRDPGALVQLRRGSLLVLAQNRDPDTGRAADADPAHRQAVRLTADPVALIDPLEQVDTGGGSVNLPVLRIEWGPEDALAFDLCVGMRPEDEPPLAVAYGNLVLADHGYSLPQDEPLGTAIGLTDPEAPPAEGAPDELKALAKLDRPKPFTPELSRRDLTFSVEPFAPADGASAASFFAIHPSEARAAITLVSESGGWTAEPDLLGAGPESQVFVTEVETDGTTRLRFGRNVRDQRSIQGKAPVEGETFAAQYRIGLGRSGNIGAGALAHIAASPTQFANVAAVTNPMPALGGVNRETIAEARQRASVAFLELKRAVTLADYETLLTLRDDVQRAQARKRWLGSWSAIFITVDRVGGLEIDQAFRDTLLAYLEPFRMMGHDLTIDAPIYVPLEITLRACAQPDAFADKVTEALRDRFSPGLTVTGQRGFFHPDNITFSSEIYLSRLYEAALDVPGVDDVTVEVFQRAAAITSTGIDEGVLRFGPREIPILSNDPNRPSEGELIIITEGGR
ncbi:MAG: putative baseplate assembly protein [Pseudomonadota bacterium]